RVGKKILLVDDDDNIRTIAVIGLEDVPDWTVIEASSGHAALQIAREERPDLILLDMMMPGMDGVMTMQKLQEQPETAGIPIIFMTAKVQTHEIASYRKLGARGVIVKPFDPITLPDDITAILDSAVTAE
ncbi:MAG TPA: response regulator, partial [Chroococcales cyanobacterium]